MNSPRPATPFFIAFAIGAALWFATSLLTARREAWDGSAYWLVTYPLAIAACAALGYANANRPWRLALVLFGAQFVAMCIRNGELGDLWPLGLVLFAFLSVPGIVAAQVASRLKRRSEGSATRP